MKLWNVTASRIRCMSVMRVLQSYLDDTTDEETARRVADHLKNCRRCGLEAKVYREIKAALGERSKTVDPETIERLQHFSELLISSETSTRGDEDV